MQKKLMKKSGVKKKMIQTWKSSMDLNVCGVMENMNQKETQKNGLAE